MIKELLEQLAPLDAQIAALRGGAQDEESQMAAITAHASELAELAVEEDEILRCCGPLTAEDRVFLARHPEFTVVEPAAALPAGMTAGEHGALSVPTRTGMDGFFLCAMQKNGEKLQ